MIDSAYVIEFSWRDNAGSGEQLVVRIGKPASPFSPLFQVLQLDRQNGRLQAVQSAVHALDYMVVLVHPAVVSKHPGLQRQCIIVSDDGAAITVGTEIFPRIEA